MTAMPSQPPERPVQASAPPPAEPESPEIEREASSQFRDAEGRPSLERILPELIRRGLEAGRGPLGKVSESIFPREIAASIVAQLGDVRSGIVKAVAQEVGRFLREADIASEVRKVLTGLEVAAQVRLRFNARKDGGLTPDLEIKIGEPSEPKTQPKPPTSTTRR
jgi:hypothetical protein